MTVWTNSSPKMIVGSPMDGPFHGATALEAPVASGSDVVLHVRVGVPVAALDELQRRLESVLTDVVREVVGPDAQFACRVEPEDTSDPSSTGSDAAVQLTPPRR